LEHDVIIFAVVETSAFILLSLKTSCRHRALVSPLPHAHPRRGHNCLRRQQGSFHHGRREPMCHSPSLERRCFIG